VTLHPDLTPDRWGALTLAEQLGNAGAEVGRAIRAHEGGTARRLVSNLDCALAQLDLTLADPRWAGHRRREIARAREVVGDLLAGDNVYRSTPASVERWFMAYAVEAPPDGRRPPTPTRDQSSPGMAVTRMPVGLPPNRVQSHASA